MGVELQNPVADDLKRHATDLRRIRAHRPVVNRSQSQEPARLAAVLRLPRRARRSWAASKSSRSGIGITNSIVCDTESNPRRFGNPPRVRISGSSYKMVMAVKYGLTRGLSDVDADIETLDGWVLCRSARGPNADRSGNP
jgi:hypothetical protein